MNKAFTPPSDENVLDIARFIFDKGRMVNQRIDRIISGIMLNRNDTVKNLTVAQADVIMAVHQKNNISVKELSIMLGVSAPSVSTMVDRLVEKEMLIRTRNNQDRRKVGIILSPGTKKQIQKVEQAVLTMFKDLIATIGTEIGDLWCKVLIAVEAALDEHPEIAEPHLKIDRD